MLTTEKIEKYREDRRLNGLFNFKINKKERAEFNNLAKKKGISASECLRILIHEAIKEEKKEKQKNGDT